MFYCKIRTCFFKFLLAAALFSFSFEAIGQCIPPSNPPCLSTCTGALSSPDPCPVVAKDILTTGSACEGQPVQMEIVNKHHTGFDHYIIYWDRINGPSETTCCPGVYCHTYFFNTSNLDCSKDVVEVFAGVKVNSISGCPNSPTDNDYTEFDIAIKPRAAFSISTDDSVCIDQPINFINNTCPGNTANMVYSWEFGCSNCTSNAFSPTFTYPSGTPTGTYTVKLTATNTANGCNLMDVATRNMKVFAKPVPITNVSTSLGSFNGTICSSDQLHLTNNSTNSDSVYWSVTVLGPSACSATPNCNTCNTTSVVFNCPGDYEVCMTVTNPRERVNNNTVCEVETCFNVTVLESASLSAFTLPSCVPNNTVNLDSHITYSGTPTRVDWSITAPGTFNANGGTSITALYPGVVSLGAVPGVPVTITANVFHSCANTTVIREVAISSPLDIPEVSISLCVGEQYTIILPPHPNGYSWDTSPHISNVSLNGDVLEIVASGLPNPDTLRVHDNSAVCQGKDSVIIIVKPGSIANPPPTLLVCMPSGLINLTPTAGTWTGPGVLGNMFDPIGLSSPVTLTYTEINSSGCSASGNTIVTISQTPVVVAGPDATICIGQAHILMPTGTWAHIGGPNPSAVSGSVFTATRSGVDSLQYTFTNADGCSGTDTTIITTEPTPLATISASPTSLCGTADSSIITVITSAANNIIWPNVPTLTVTSGSTATAKPINTTGYIISVESALSCVYTETVTIAVDTFPIPAMEFNNPVCRDSLVHFLATSDPVFSYDWRIYDSNGTLVSTNGNQSFSQSFATSDTFTVKLIADNNGCKDSISKELSVLDPPSVNFELMYDSVRCSPLTVTLQPDVSGDYDSLAWQKDGVRLVAGSNTLTDEISTLPPDPDTVEYCLLVYSSCGVIRQCDSVIVFPTSVAGVAISALNICPTDTLAIDNATELQDRVQYYIIDFGFGLPDTVIHFDRILIRYPNASDTTVYTITVTAIGTCNDTTKDSIDVTVAANDSLLDAFITADIIRGCAPLTINFEGPATGFPTNWWWDFGDLTYSSEQNPVHIYQESGNYRPMLIVWNECSIDTILYDDPLIDSIEVYDPVIFDFHIEPAEPCVGSLITVVVDSAPGGTFRYSFGDPPPGPTLAFIKEPSHAYVAAGNYTITGMATIILPNCTVTDSVQLIVRELPNVDIMLFSDSIGCSPMDIGAAINSPGSVSVIWDFGDDSLGGIGSEVEHTYLNDSTDFINYNLKVIVRNIYSCQDSSSRMITVMPNSMAKFNLHDTTLCSVPQTLSILNLTDDFSNIITWFVNGDLIGNDDSLLTLLIENEDKYEVKMVAGNRFECFDTAFVTIKAFDDFKLFFPNAFSPNGDGINDKYYVIGSNVGRFSIGIFDRWGTLVYSSSDIGKGWDGNNKNKPAEVGVYVYYIKATSVHCEVDRGVWKGSITLLR